MPMLVTRLEQRNGFRRLLLLSNALVLSSLPFLLFRPSVKGASFLWGKKCDGMQAGDVFLFSGLSPPFPPPSLFFFASSFFFPFLLFFSLLMYGKLLSRLKVKFGLWYILLEQLDNCNVRIGYV